MTAIDEVNASIVLVDIVQRHPADLYSYQPRGHAHLRELSGIGKKREKDQLVTRRQDVRCSCDGGVPGQASHRRARQLG